MSQFIKGLPLCHEFFCQVANPIIKQHFPNLRYSAGLIGYGSDVLGYDDATSTDHMWGPRFYLFLNEKDLPLKEKIMQALSNQLPCQYKGYSVNFSPPDPADGGVRVPVKIDKGPVSPLIFIDTFENFLQSYLGVDFAQNLTEQDWLALSQHKLLALTSGKMFVDDLGVENALKPLKFYPDSVWLYLIASNWALIASEQAFVRRCADVGDDIGSRLACGRILERLMRLCFLYCRRYAPYSKWFGTAFATLPLNKNLVDAIHGALCAQQIQQREDFLVQALVQVATLHQSLNITKQVPIEVQPYFDRDIKVIFADKFAQATAQQLVGTPLEHCPLIGALCEIANFVEISDNPKYQANIKHLYQ